MSSSPAPRPGPARPFARWGVATAVTAVLALGAASCGGSSSGTSDAGGPADPVANGHTIASSHGCAGCHGKDFDGGIGPSWHDLAGSQVELADGTTVTADDAYLTRAIADPGADIVKGYTIKMPTNNLSADQIADVVAYIKSLSTLDDDASSSGASGSGERPLAGIVRDPAPQVDETTLPSLSTPGDDISFRAQPGGLQVVYFGYTNCPDVCPTTMADLTVALRKLPDGMADRIDTVMVTVDPDRDLDVLDTYVKSFIPTARAAGTTDADQLAAAAAPFGVVYDVTSADDGTIEVSHSGFLYLIDDQGELVLSWPFGTSSDQMAADIQQVLEAQTSS